MNLSKRTIFSWAAVILWMAIIFILSHQPASVSSNLSSGITEAIIRAFERIMPDAQFDIRNFHFVVRKNAHFIAYFVLGFLTFHALRQSGVRGIRSFLFSFGICALYAISDEVHQLFIPGRSGEVRDVVIDSAGACAGIAVFGLLARFISKNKRSFRSDARSSGHSFKRI
ncbi:VanZ family protein [Planococcus salinus]|uniref:VanZ family protein n=1 Tax=Planococcus salinus TaxID=1848460 RepID=A0A3M8P8L1_9BACL|nr:VanZ family protein [Planococcus salinus]RNF39534.1 VanZ family protein [Planococcus salinus]